MWNFVLAVKLPGKNTESLAPRCINRIIGSSLPPQARYAAAVAAASMIYILLLAV